MKLIPFHDHALNRITVNREREFYIDWHEGEWPEPDFEEACKGIHCMSGVVAVEMVPPRSTYGAIHVPDTAQKRLRAHFGVVVSNADCSWLAVGDRVCVRAYRGLHFEPLSCVGLLQASGLTGFEDVRLHRDYVAIQPSVRAPLPLGILRSVEKLSHTGSVVAAGEMSGCSAGDQVVFSRYHHKLRAGGLNEEEYSRLDAFEGCILQHKQLIYARLKESGYFGEYVRFLGGLYPLNESILMIERDGVWRPAPGWVWIERDLVEESEGVLLTDRAARDFRLRAKIIRSASDPNLDGLDCLVNPDPNLALWFGMRSDSARFQLIRERDVYALLVS